MSLTAALALDPAELFRLRELRARAGRAVERSLRVDGIAPDSTSDGYVAGVAAYFGMVEGSTEAVPYAYFETAAEATAAAALPAPVVLAAAERLARAVQRYCEARGDGAGANFARTLASLLRTVRPSRHLNRPRTPRRNGSRASQTSRTSRGDPSSSDPPSPSPRRPRDGLQGRLLADVLELHGVDVEDYAAGVLTNYLKARGAALSHHERQDALAYLIAEAWELHRAYDGRGTFRGYLSSLLGRRLADWYRKQRGDSRYAVGRVEVVADSDSATLVDQADDEDVSELALANLLSIPRHALSKRSRETLDVIERVVAAPRVSPAGGELEDIAVSWTDRTRRRRRLELAAELKGLGVTSELSR